MQGGGGSGRRGLKEEPPGEDPSTNRQGIVNVARCEQEVWWERAF